jgi:catechol 2,3-dioxygenase-like lactoylglutathione lyase family enzyme
MMFFMDAPKVYCDKYHAGVPVADLQAAIDFYTKKLGFSLGFLWGDPPMLAGVNLGDVQIFLSERAGDPKGTSLFFIVSNADELCEFHRASGVEIIEALEDRAYGLRDYAIRDLDGCKLAFGHYIYNAGPPIKIERVDIPVRLEKRLAGLLADLAEHKRMTVNSCLEEILLHTCEPFGDGVASPHTTTTLKYIQDLKKKHGIDYDSHGSYRFVESAP